MNYGIYVYYPTPESVLSENTALQDNNKYLEEKIWCLELEKKRQSYNSDQIILGLHLPGKKMMLGDCMSSTSSGFASYDQSLTGVVGSNIIIYTVHIFIAVPTVSHNTRDMQEEAERLSELIGVMEVREEQLLEQMEEVELARKKAEEKVNEKHGIISTMEQKNEMGRKVKNALLLTAAFGAVHTALQQDMVMGCMPM